jgi:hypothetical protein
LFGGSYAQAAAKSETKLDQISFNLGSFFAPSQFDVDGIVYHLDPNLVDWAWRLTKDVPDCDANTPSDKLPKSCYEAAAKPSCSIAATLP